MQKSLSKGYTGWAQLGILIGLIFGAFIVASIVSIIIIVVMTHAPLLGIEKEILKPKNVNAVLVVQCVSTLVMFFLPAFFFAKICYTNSIGFLGYKGVANWKQILIIILVVAASMPLIGSLANLNKMIPLPRHLRMMADAAEKAYNDQVVTIAQIKTWPQYVVSLFVIALLPALFEETLFRGGLQNMLTRWLKKPWLAILITSVVFSAIHFSWYGFLARAVLGAMLGFIFYVGQNIWLNISLHFLNNGIAVTSMFVTYKSGKPLNMDDDYTLPLWTGVVGLILVIELFKWFKKVSPPPIFFDDANVDYNNPFKKDENWA